MRNGVGAESWFGFHRKGLILCLMAFLASFGFSQLGSERASAQEAKVEPPAEPAAAENTAKEAPPEAGTGEEEGDALPPPKSYLKWLYDASGPFGICIGIESVILVALLVMGVMQFRRNVFIPPDFVAEFEGKLNAKDYQGAFESAKREDSFLGKLVAGGMSRLSQGYDSAVAAMQEVGEDENMAIDHKLSYVSLIGSTAPMLGLLGTVQGMVQAFSVIAQSTTSPKPNELAEGITLALVTTLEGLIVAIPAVIGFALLKNQQARLMFEVGRVADALMSRFSGKPRPVTSAQAAPAQAAPASPSR